MFFLITQYYNAKKVLLNWTETELKLNFKREKGMWIKESLWVKQKDGETEG